MSDGAGLVWPGNWKQAAPGGRGLALRSCGKAKPNNHNNYLGSLFFVQPVLFEQCREILFGIGFFFSRNGSQIKLQVVHAAFRALGGTHSPDLCGLLLICCTPHSLSSANIRLKHRADAHSSFYINPLNPFWNKEGCIFTAVTAANDLVMIYVLQSSKCCGDSYLIILPLI